MTQRALRNIMFSTLSLSLLCLVLYAVAALGLFGRGFSAGRLRSLGELQRYWRGLDPGLALWTVLDSGAAVVLGAAGGVLLHFRPAGGRRSWVFFRVFLASLCLSALRPLTAVMMHAGAPLEAGLISTKLAHFGEYIGVFSFFAQSFYDQDPRFRREGTVLGILAVTAVFLAYSLAVDVTDLGSYLLFRIGRENYLWAAMLVFSLLTVANYARSALGPRLAAVTLIVAGRNMIFLPVPALIGPAGAVLLAAGVLMFSTEAKQAVSSEAADSP